MVKEFQNSVLDLVFVFIRVPSPSSVIVSSKTKPSGRRKKLPVDKRRRNARVYTAWVRTCVIRTEQCGFQRGRGKKLGWERVYVTALVGSSTSVQEVTSLRCDAMVGVMR